MGTSWVFLYPRPSAGRLHLSAIVDHGDLPHPDFSSFVREQAQRRQIRSAFGQYLSPALVEQLAQSPERLVLGGRGARDDIMFSDSAAITAISETYKSDPQG